MSKIRKINGMDTKNSNNASSDKNSDNIVVFDLRDDDSKGQPSGDDKPNVNEKSEIDKPDESLEKKQETAKDKPDGENISDKEKPNGEDKPENKNDDKSEKKSDNEKLSDKELTFEFDSDEKDTKKPDQKSDKEKQETATVNKEGVLAFLKENGFESIKDLTDLSIKETLPEAVSKFKKFHEETNGRGIEDFYNLQKNWDDESPENRIKTFLKLKYPTLSEEQLQTQFDVYNVTEQDEDDLSPRELTKAKAEFDKIDGEAKTFLKQKQKEYETPLGGQVQQKQQKPTEEDVIKTHGNYWKQRDAELDKVNEFSFNIKDLGQIKVEIDADDKKAIQARTRTTDDMIESWANPDKSLNAKQLVLDNMFAIPSVRQKILKGVAEQVHSLTIEKLSKENRNVDLDNLNNNHKQKQSNNGELIVFKDQNSVESDNQFGQPVFIPKRNK